jgi:hypothetical protein
MKGMRNKLRVTKIALVTEFGGKCQRCGYDRCMRALQFHHTDDSEKKEWNEKNGRYGGASAAEIKAHPERFVLLCANCHFEEHDRIDQENQLIATCLDCGCSFKTEAHRGKAGRGNFCSRDCYWKHRHKIALANLPDRLWKHVEKVSDCWVWTSHCCGNTPVMNYPLGYRMNKVRPAAQILWELERGSLGEGQEVWRTCKTPRCIRPDHQILGTRKSMLTHAGRARRIAARNGENRPEVQGELPI